MGKVFDTIEQVLNDIDPALAEDWRRYKRRPLVRLRRWWYRWWVIPRLKRKRKPETKGDA